MFDATASKEKVKRAQKHIDDLVSLLENFAASQLYSVSVEECSWEHGWLRNELVITINPDSPFRIEAALLIGDVLHNLRSALDLLYFQTVLFCAGTPSKYTRFPIRDRREELEAAISSAEKNKQITPPIGSFILDSIKPYELGNHLIWALDELNIRDKHKLLIPTFKVMCITGICLRNEHTVLRYDTVFTSDGFRRRLDETIYGRHPMVDDKGKASVGIGFEFGVPFSGESVFPALNGILDEVTRTIEAFESFLGMG